MSLMICSIVVILKGIMPLDLEKTINVDELPFYLRVLRFKDKYWFKGLRHGLYQLVFID